MAARQQASDFHTGGAQKHLNANHLGGGNPYAHNEDLRRSGVGEGNQLFSDDSSQLQISQDSVLRQS